jgi:acyl-CoA synthetase (AMP-forming)/AMP-acid ligase II
MTAGEMLTRNANKFPLKTALVSEDVSLNFKALNERVNRFANALIKKGLQKGDRIGVLVVNIYLREIEEVLYKHPAVSEASVIGLPDEHWGEVVKAVIVLKKGASATVVNFIRQGEEILFKLGAQHYSIEEVADGSG